MENHPHHYIYEINFENGNRYRREMVIDRIDGKLIEEESIPDELKEFALLDFCKCEHCPYSSNDFKYCPVFQNIANVISEFKNNDPHEIIEAKVFIENKTVVMKGELQVALTSLIGLLMASSECEYFDFLKPMVKTHQPFSSYEETLIRVVSLYFLDRFLRGHTLDWDIKELKKEYQSLEKVNAGILARIKSIRGGVEVEREAVLILDSFIKNFSWEYELNLDDVKEFFQKGRGFLNL